MLRNILRGAALFTVVAILAVEGFFVYRFYQNLPSSPDNGVAADSGASVGSKAFKATAPETTNGLDSANPDGPEIASAFIHRATPENSRGDYTYLDDPVANGDPDAVLLVTAAVDQEDGAYNDRNIGVWYEPNRQRWAIFNQDLAPIPAGTIFNVVVLRTPENAVLRAAPANTDQYSTYLDHPVANGNPGAVLAVTQNWNPGGGGGTYNNHPVGIRYDADNQRWAVFNKDLASIPEGAVFNVAVWEDGN
ncbi:MAG: hypothetical protein M3338_06610 [Actinomycetota bacterium]|nr:hypothetical protein [Actinomycetota bacterium]